jgi:two-component system, chemotaxis family, protein-glutamate methylesterase/glutaminase
MTGTHSARAKDTTVRPRVLIVIAASAGGIEAIRILLAGLPANLPAAIAIVQHRTNAQPNFLAQVLARATPLAVKFAQEGEPLHASTVYVAPPDMHMTVLPDGSVRLVDGTRIRHVLSSANPLFESAPDAFGSSVIAVVLTGANIDATDGVQCIAKAGGRVIAEDPASAHQATMPRSAIATGAVHEVLPLDGIAPRLVELVQACRPAAREQAARS